MGDSGGVADIAPNGALAQHLHKTITMDGSANHGAIGLNALVTCSVGRIGISFFTMYGNALVQVGATGTCTLLLPDLNSNLGQLGAGQITNTPTGWFMANGAVNKFGNNALAANVQSNAGAKMPEMLLDVGGVINLNVGTVAITGGTLEVFCRWWPFDAGALLS